MAHEIKMPQLGLTMTEGTIGRWLKQEGELVNKGEALVEIETDKLASEIESDITGILLKILQQEGDEVPVQGVICLIGDEKENIVDSESTSENSVNVETSLVVENVQQLKEQQNNQINGQAINDYDRIKASPLAKKIALEKNIKLTTVRGSGPGGRIVKRDILNYQADISPVNNSISGPIPDANAVTKIADGERREKMKSMRKTVATRMLQSHLEIPNVTQTIKVDVTDLLAFRKQLNVERDEEHRLSVNDFILKATAKALSLHKDILVSIEGNEIIYHDNVNLGMAVSIDSGLIVPVIKHAELLTLENLSANAKALAKKTRDGVLSADEYQGSTFTVSNLGMYGIESFTPIINQPDAAILGVCAAQEELALNSNDELVKKQVMRLSLTFDHRLLDGVAVAKFQKTLSQLLEKPINILL